LLLFIIVPALLILFYAFTDANNHFTFDNFLRFFTESGTRSSFIMSVWVGILTTAVCIAIGYPVAFILARTKVFKAKGLIVLFILPMWVNFLLRTLATRTLFESLGISPGLGTTIFGMVYNFVPFMILPIYTTLLKMDQSYIEAAQDLGANNVTSFFKVTLPLSLPGMLSGVLMVFMPTISTYAIADILSRNTLQLFGNLIKDYMYIPNWNYASALAVIMLIIVGVAMAFGSRDKNPAEEERW
jgi:spermidine/putrescine transport system permease protein